MKSTDGNLEGRRREKPGTSSPSRGWCLWLWPYLCPGSSFFPDKPSMMLPSPGSRKLLLYSLFLQPRLVLYFFCCPSLVLSLSPFQLFGHLCYQGPELNSLLSNSKNSFCFLDLILQAKWRKYVKMEGVINYAKCCWEVSKMRVKNCLLDLTKWGSTVTWPEWFQQRGGQEKGHLCSIRDHLCRFGSRSSPPKDLYRKDIE